MQYCGCPPSTIMARHCCMACLSWICSASWLSPSRRWRWPRCALCARTLGDEHVKDACSASFPLKAGSKRAGAVPPQGHHPVGANTPSSSFFSPCVFSLDVTVSAADVSVCLLPTSCRLSYQFFQLLLHQLCDRCNFRV